eukprot:333318-Rhodomonas_salina.2
MTGMDGGNGKAVADRVGRATSTRGARRGLILRVLRGNEMGEDSQARSRPVWPRSRHAQGSRAAGVGAASGEVQLEARRWGCCGTRSPTVKPASRCAQQVALIRAVTVSMGESERRKPLCLRLTHQQPRWLLGHVCVCVSLSIGSHERCRTMHRVCEAQFTNTLPKCCNIAITHGVVPTSLPLKSNHVRQTVGARFKCVACRVPLTVLTRPTCSKRVRLTQPAVTVENNTRDPRPPMMRSRLGPTSVRCRAEPKAAVEALALSNWRSKVDHRSVLP